jgi:mannose-6-phosphate isomerase-like protein (cupin superfamily)
VPNKRKQLSFKGDFTVALTNSRGQAATMVIAPGDSEGGPDNDHRGADQWLFVLSGTGTGRLNGKSHGLRAGTLILIGAA